MRFKQSGDGKFFVVAEKDPLWIDLTMVFDPATGILNAEAESLEGGYSKIEIDLAAEFWRMTRRETAKELPPVNNPIFVGHDTPVRVVIYDGKTFEDEYGGLYALHEFESWWLRPTAKKE